MSPYPKVCIYSLVERTLTNNIINETRNKIDMMVLLSPMQSCRSFLTYSFKKNHDYIKCINLNSCLKIKDAPPFALIIWIFSRPFTITWGTYPPTPPHSHSLISVNGTNLVKLNFKKNKINADCLV